MRKMIAADIGLVNDGKLICSACGGDEFLRPYSPWHSVPICRPCFIVWYDGVAYEDQTNPEAIGRESLRLKALGDFPWTGTCLSGNTFGAKMENGRLLSPTSAAGRAGNAKG